MVSLKAMPAVWAPGFGTVKETGVARGLTVMLPDVPVTEPWVAVSLVVWASYRVTEAVPVPPAKATLAG